MLKATHDSHDYLTRTGSHSLRPLANGCIPDIPHWAAEPEAYYNSLREQFEQTKNQWNEVSAKLRPLTDALKTALPWDDYQAAKAQHEELGQVHQHLQRKLEEMRPLVAMAEKQSFAALCFYVAQRYLPDETLVAIKREVADFMRATRPLPLIPRQKSAKTEGGKQHEKLKLRRRLVRVHHERDRQLAERREEVEQARQVAKQQDLEVGRQKYDSYMANKLQRLKDRFG